MPYKFIGSHIMRSHVTAILLFIWYIVSQESSDTLYSNVDYKHMIKIFKIKFTIQMKIQQRCLYEKKYLKTFSTFLSLFSCSYMYTFMWWSVQLSLNGTKADSICNAHNFSEQMLHFIVHKNEYWTWKWWFKSNTVPNVLKLQSWKNRN